jgi:hypothetical protein
LLPYVRLTVVRKLPKLDFGALRPNLKILIVTGYAENATVGNGHLDPGMEVITKPFVMTELANNYRAD